MPMCVVMCAHGGQRRVAEELWQGVGAGVDSDCGAGEEARSGGLAKSAQSNSQESGCLVPFVAKLFAVLLDAIHTPLSHALRGDVVKLVPLH